MVIRFSKMHGIGNDFVVIDAINQTFEPSAEQVRRISDRHFGVGCDQLLLVESCDRDDIDFRYRIFNADGGEVQQCGNGARCFARFVRDRGLTDKDIIDVETASGDIRLYIEEDGQVRVNMGVPDFTPAALPMMVDQEAEQYAVALDSTHPVTIGAVSMGNPHAVLRVADVTTAPVAELGPLLESHKLFPERVNVGFMQIVDDGHIRLRVYERGAAETLACGTGACAAVAIGQRWGALAETVDVELAGGHLTIQWSGESEPLWMTGPAERVFEGEIDL